MSFRALFFAFEMVLISATMLIGLALPMAEYFHRFSFTGLSANLLIVPAMNAVVPLGFIGDLHRLALDRIAGRRAAAIFGPHCRLACEPRAGLASSGPAAMVHAGFRGRPGRLRGSDPATRIF